METGIEIWQMNGKFTRCLERGQPPRILLNAFLCPGQNPATQVLLLERRQRSFFGEIHSKDPQILTLEAS